jgi:hypothetical protein
LVHTEQKRGEKRRREVERKRQGTREGAEEAERG